MGYTHYFTTRATLKNEVWSELLTDVAKIISASGITIGGWDGLGAPTLSSEKIVFNGSPAYETFHLPHKGNGFEFCKTARLPYDKVVTAVLIRARDYYGDEIQLSSDGDWVEWSEGVQLYTQVFDSVPENVFKGASNGE